MPGEASPASSAPHAEGGPTTSYRTRVTLDVLASRLLDERELAASSSSDLDLEDGARSTASDSGAGGDGGSRPVSAMSLQSVAMAQQALHKPIPFVRGGACVEFTRDDLSRLHDADTLRFLEENSPAFTQRTRPRRASSPPHDTQAQASPNPPSPAGAATTAHGTSSLDTSAVAGVPDAAAAAAAATRAQLEAEIEALQRDIETFITAVDDDGHTYEIQLHQKGVLQVPVDVDKELAALEAADAADDGDDADHDADSAAGSDDDGGRPTTPKLSEASVDSADAAVVVPSAKASPEKAAKHKPARPGAALRKPTPPPPTSQPAKTTARPSPGHKSASARASARPLVTQRPPSIKVRTAHQLSADEEQRVSALLDGTVDLHAENPCRRADQTTARIARIDDALTMLRRARAAADDEPRRLDTTTTTATTTGPNEGASATDYLAQAKVVAKADRQMNALNAKLLRLEREMELLALYHDAQDVPAELLACRPAWARGPGTAIEDPALPARAPNLVTDEAVVAQMLAEAAAEQQRAEAAGVTTAQSATSAPDPFVGLRADARSAAAQAALLLAELDGVPLELTEVPDTVEATLTDDADADADVADDAAA